MDWTLGRRPGVRREGQNLRLPASTVRRIEGLQQRPDGLLNGALIGAGVGFGAGIGALAAYVASVTSSGPIFPQESLPYYLSAGAIGAASAPRSVLPPTRCTRAARCWTRLPEERLLLASPATPRMVSHYRQGTGAGSLYDVRDRAWQQSKSAEQWSFRSPVASLVPSLALIAVVTSVDSECGMPGDPV